MVNQSYLGGAAAGRAVRAALSFREIQDNLASVVAIRNRTTSSAADLAWCDGFLSTVGVCERCGSEKPAGQSCGCFDNGGQ